MRKKDQVKLNILSNIDEEFIDEVTDSRITLSQKVQHAAARARRKWITIGSIAASLVILAAVFLTIFILLSGSSSPEQYIPVYQGMTIRKNMSTLEHTQAYSGVSVMKLNAPGHGAPDKHQKPKEELKEDIRDIVDIEIVGDDEVKYYVQPNETFIIEVHISNPKDYEIQSFTLNGKKYANYMFKEGSTMETLLLEVTAPATSGYTEYTIDAIKYIDGTEIKDVDMSSGDKSVKAGVAYPTAPSATVVSQELSTTTLELSIQIEDPYALIGENELAIYLSDGKTVVDKQTLRIGDNTVIFTDLVLSKTYEYGIMTAYDLVDGQETHKEWLLTEQFTTPGAFAINEVVPGKDSISFEVTHVGEIGEIKSISLYDAATDQQVESGGSEMRIFENLLSNHTYNLYVDYTYTVAGTEIEDWVAVKGIVTLAKEVPTLTFGAASSDKTSVSYAVEVTDADQILHVTRVELLRGEEIVKENGVSLSGAFDGLLSNTKYTVKVSYTYDPGDGRGEIADSISKEITTVEKVAPTLTFGAVSSDKTSVSYAVEVTDADQILHVTRVELLRGEEIVKENGVSLSGVFDGLLSNTKYTVKVSYTYDPGDGRGEIADSISKEIATVEKVVPKFTFSNIHVTDTQMSGRIIMTDTDAVGTMISADLYRNKALIKKNTAQELSFTGLDYYSDYQIVVSYSYDLNDGKGVRKQTVTYDFKTAPHLTFNSCSAINTSAVSDGETIFLQVNITNPNQVVYQKIIVNGAEYDVVKNSSTDTMLVCEIVNNGQFEGGNNTLTIEKVIAELGGNTYTIEPQSNNTAYVFINGILEVVGMNVVVPENGQYVKHDYVCPSDEAYLQIELNNKTGYSIDSVDIGSMIVDSSSLIKLDDEHYLIDLQSIGYQGTGIVHQELGAVQYSNGEFRKTLTPQAEYIFFYLGSDDVHYISTAEDLLNMNDGHYYELTNDIDLAGMEWRGAPFYGVFDGNGYAIKNMSYVGTVTNRDAYLGLFTEASGVIKNLNIENARFIVKQEVTDGSDDRAYVVKFGSIAAHAGDMLVIDNCHLDENSYINIDYINYVLSSNKYGSDSSCIGGLIGWGGGNYGRISNCTNNGYIAGYGIVGGVAGIFSNIINCTNNGTVMGSGYIGGIIGSAEDYEIGGILSGCVNNGTVTGQQNVVGGIAGRTYVSIVDCTNYGDVTGTEYIGGIAGRINNQALNFISKCINHGSITGTDYVGGIVGTAIRVNNCTNYGDVVGEYVYIGGIAGYVREISNCTNYGHVAGDETDKYGENTDSVGGIAGRANLATNCNNNGLVTGQWNVGGIIGIGYYNNNTDTAEAVITNCINNGSVKATKDYVGSIVGLGSTAASISHCVNIGSISGRNSTGAIAGGNTMSGTMADCYALNQNATAAELSSKKFYTETLGFDETVWNFDNLNIGAGKYPVLKQP